MKKNPHDRILKREPKEPHLNTVPKSCYILSLELLTFSNWALCRNKEKAKKNSVVLDKISMFSFLIETIVHWKKKKD